VGVKVRKLPGFHNLVVMQEPDEPVKQTRTGAFIVHVHNKLSHKVAATFVCEGVHAKKKVELSFAVPSA